MQNRNINWHILLRTLLGKEGLPFTVVDLGKDLKLSTKPEKLADLKAALSKILKKPFQNLAYEVDDALSLLTENAPEAPEEPGLTLDEAKAILYRLFPREIFKKVGMDPELIFGENASAKQRVLFSMPYEDNNAVSFLESLEKNILAPKLPSLSLEQLRNIFLGKKASEAATALVTPEDQAMAERVVKESFGIMAASDHSSARLYFNYGKLFHGLFLPRIKADKAELTISKDHFLELLRLHYPPDQPLWQTIKGKDEGQITAKPIFLMPSSGTGSPASLLMLTDRSGSMRDDFLDLKGHISNFLDNLSEQNSDTTVRLCFFETNKGPELEVSLNEVERLKKFVQDTDTDGATRLLDTIEEELEQQLNNPRDNYALVLFSDGEDNVSKYTRDVALERIELLVKAFEVRGLALPKIFTIGFGAVDVHLMKSLAAITMGTYTQLKSMADFVHIQNYLDQIGSKRQLLKFSVYLEEQRAIHSALNSLSFTLPLYESDRPQMPDIRIPLLPGQSIVSAVEGKELRVTVSDLTKVREPDLLDQALDLLSTSYQAILSEKGLSQKRKELSDNAEKLQALADQAQEGEKALIVELQQEFNALSQHWQNNPHSAESEASKTQVQFNRGILSQTGALLQPEKPAPWYSPSNILRALEWLNPANLLPLVAAAESPLTLQEFFSHQERVDMLSKQFQLLRDNSDYPSKAFLDKVDGMEEELSELKDSLLSAVDEKEIEKQLRVLEKRAFQISNSTSQSFWPEASNGLMQGNVSYLPEAQNIVAPTQPLLF